MFSRLPLIAGMSALLWCSQAFAGLGGDVASIHSDEEHFQTRAQVTSASSYAVHEMQTGTGTTIHEFVSPLGKVFAVSWKGPSLPDLQQLLGEHFQEFQEAAQAQNKRGGHGPVRIVLPSGLVVELGGHMRSFSGRAYLSDQMPANVRAEDLR